MFVLIFFLSIVALEIVAVILGNISVMLAALVAGIIFIYDIAIIVPNLAVSVRRLHDTDHSAWWLLIALIPLVGAIVLFVFLVTDGTPGSNRYGANPKEPMAAAMASAPMPPPPFQTPNIPS
jgi:uncharacterized membrane protein YhaH (DUF805 family)